MSEDVSEIENKLGRLLPRFKDSLARQMADPEFAQGYEQVLAEVRFGAEMARLRELRGLSQSEIAGVPQATISRIENGRRPDLKTLFSITNALGAQVIIEPGNRLLIRAAQNSAKAARRTGPRAKKHSDRI